MKLLLHVCCGPCAIYPVKKLKEEGIEVHGIFYNPNIHPAEEYEKRKEAAKTFASQCGFDITYQNYEPSAYFSRTDSVKDEKEKRCRECWGLRLEETARRAKRAKHSGFEGFSTTLLISPYQDHDEIKKIGSQISEKEGIEFFYLDFRDGFKDSQSEAKAMNIYRQKYCGCVYSK